MSAEKRRDFASVAGGVLGKPIFKFLLSHVVPCMLHCVMAIVQKMIRLLAREASM